MATILLDTNVILDIWDRDPVWHAGSSQQMRKLSHIYELAINPIVYAELAPRFTDPATLNEKLADLGIVFENIPRDAAFFAGKAHLYYRSRGGAKSSVLADFFIGAHALALGCPVLTRDTRRYSTYFPEVRLIAPDPRLC
jgi:hypothetical protein